MTEAPTDRLLEYLREVSDQRDSLLVRCRNLEIALRRVSEAPGPHAEWAEEALRLECEQPDE